MESFEQFIALDKNILILASQPLDFDCLGSGLILKKYLESLDKEVTLIFPRPFTPEEKECNQFLPYFSEIEDKDSREVLKDGKFDLLIFIDGTSLIQFYDYKKDINNPPDITIYPKRIHLDHHLQHPEDLGTLTIQRPKVSSTAEIIVNEILPEGFIDENISTLAYAAIVGDTGSFRWNFYPSTFNLAAKLLEKGADPYQALDRLFFSKSKLYLQMLSFAIQNLEYRNEMDTILLCLPYQLIQKENISKERLEELKNAFQWEIAKNIKGYARGFLLCEEVPGKIHISARGDNLHNKINMPKMLQEIGGNGGGHFNACNAGVEGKFEEVKEKLIKLIEKYQYKLQEGKEGDN